MGMVSCRKCKFLKPTGTNRICMIPYDKMKPKAKNKRDGIFGVIIACENGMYRRKDKQIPREELIMILQRRYMRDDITEWSIYSDDELRGYYEGMLNDMFGNDLGQRYGLRRRETNERE